MKANMIGKNSPIIIEHEYKQLCCLLSQIYKRAHYIDTKIAFDIDGIYQIIKNCILHDDNDIFSYEMHPLNDAVKLCFLMNMCKDVKMNFDIDVDKKNVLQNEKSFVEFISDIKKELSDLKQSNDELIKKCRNYGITK
jgi:hypothetical protein